jgi:hypothetical protein
MGGGGRREWAVRGRHFHVAFVDGGGENIVVASSKRKWRVSLRNSTKKYKNRHLFFFYFSARRHLVILPFVSVSLITQLVWEMSRFANQTAVSNLTFFCYIVFQTQQRR